jgi:hypothetical protein
MSLSNPTRPGVWIPPFDDMIFVADLTGFYGPAIAVIEGMKDIFVELPDPGGAEAAVERRTGCGTPRRPARRGCSRRRAGSP